MVVDTPFKQTIERDHFVIIIYDKKIFVYKKNITNTLRELSSIKNNKEHGVKI